MHGACRLLGRPLVTGASKVVAGLPGRAFSSSRLPAKIKGEELLGEPLDAEQVTARAPPIEERHPVSEPLPVDLEAEHARVEDPEVPMLSSMFESHQVPKEALSKEEAAAEVERYYSLLYRLSLCYANRDLVAAAAKNPPFRETMPAD